jgi:uncharacterized repeat protein (TIGR01451 family)/gliding motility-associated-like protein
MKCHLINCRKVFILCVIWALSSGFYVLAQTDGANTATKQNAQMLQSVAATANADLSVTVEVNTQTPKVGDNVTFSIRVMNNGPSDATLVTANDLLPTGYAYVSSTSSAGNYNPSTGVWRIGNMALGGSATLTLVAMVNATGVYSNVIGCSAAESDPVTSNNSVAVTPSIPSPSADVGILLGVDNLQPKVGDNVTFTLKVINGGPSAATGVSATDLLPSGCVYVSSNAPAGTSYSASSGVWTVGNLAVNAEMALSVVATVKASGVYNSTATVAANESDPSGSNNTSSTISLSVQPVTDLSITKTIDNMNPKVGDNVVFTITVLNNGPSVATGIKATDKLLSGYTFVSASSNAGTYNSSTGIWNIGSLSSGSTAKLDITVRVNAKGIYGNNAAKVTGTEIDPVLSNNITATVVPNGPQPVVDLAIAQSCDKQSATVGDQVTFTITALSYGPSAATGVSVSNLLPSGFSFVSSNAARGNYNSKTGVWTIGNVNSGELLTLTIVTAVMATGTYTCNSVISGNEIDPVTSNDTASASLPAPTPVTDLAITQSIGNMTPNVGDTLTVVLKITNNGPSQATNVVATDALPSGLSYVSSVATQGTYGTVNGAASWQIGALACNANVTITMKVKVLASGIYTNYATVAATEADAATGNNTTLLLTPVPTAGKADVSIAVAVNPQTPSTGATVTFTITATNNGPSNATNVTVADLLSTGYTYLSSSAGTGSYSSSTGIWTIGSLANGASASLTVSATVKAPASGIYYNNYASVSAAEKDPKPDNNSSSVSPLIGTVADVAITQSIDKLSPHVGETVTITLAVTNNGTGNATGVIAFDKLPSGLLFVTSSGSGSYTSNNGQWAIGNLNKNVTATLKITATVLTIGNYANAASVKANEADLITNNNATPTLTLQPLASCDLSVNKSLGSMNPVVGDVVTFSLGVTNEGPSNASGVIVSDLLPPGYSFISGSASQGNYNGGDGAWYVGNLDNGAFATLDISARVNASGPYINIATVSGDEYDPVPTNNSSPSVTPNGPSAVSDLSIVCSADKINPNVNNNVVFTILVTNNGPSPATNVRATAVLPTGYTYQSNTLPSGTTFTQGSGLWNIGTLAVGEDVTMTITAKVNMSGDYKYAVAVTGGPSDSQSVNNFSDITPIPQALTDLTITKVADNMTPRIGDNIRFTITVHNSGPSAATGVSVTDKLTSGYTFVSSTAVPATSTYNSNTGIWFVGNMASNSDAVLNINASVNQTGDFSNTAFVSGSESDPSFANNQTVVVKPTPVLSSNLSVTKAMSNRNPNVGDTIQFTVTVKNNGINDASAVVVRDTLQQGYTYLSGSMSQGIYNKTAGVWEVGNLSVGAEAALTITAKVNATGGYVNNASVSSAQNDPDISDNTATVTPSQPKAVADIAIVKYVDNIHPVVGEQAVFTVEVINNGPSDATGVMATDILPSGYVFVSANCPSGTSFNSGTGIWTIDKLANGNSVAMQLTTKVNTSGNYGNAASVSSVTNDPNLNNNNTPTVPVVPVYKTDLSVNKTVNNTHPMMGDTVAFVITVKNNGPNTATNAFVSDTLKSGYVFVSSKAAKGSYNASSGQWHIGVMANGETDTLKIMAKVQTTGIYTNAAYINSIEFDPVPANNMAQVSIIPENFMLVTKHATKPKWNSDGTFSWRYVITITNRSSDLLKNIHIADSLIKVFPDPVILKEMNVSTGSSFTRNPAFNGTSDCQLLSAGTLTAVNTQGAQDSVMVDVKIDSHGFIGQVYNQAITGATSDVIGTSSGILSDDSSASGTPPRATKTDIPDLLLTVKDAFSPNNDEVNDKFIIVHSKSLKIEFEVFNRWGSKVYENKDYRNDWDGRGTGSFAGENLPDGTYFYVVRGIDDQGNLIADQSGYLTLRR